MPLRFLAVSLTALAAIFACSGPAHVTPTTASRPGTATITSEAPGSAPVPAAPAPLPAGDAPASPAPAGGLDESSLPPFRCADSSESGTSSRFPVTGLTAIRAAGHPGFDRIVVEFNGALTEYDVMRQADATFVQDASGLPSKLAGSAGLRIVLRHASAHETYGGSNDLTPRLTNVREARLIGDFEGVTTLGVGLSRQTCIRVFTLTNPTRLVVDVQI